MIDKHTDFYSRSTTIIKQPHIELLRGSNYSSNSFMTIVITTYNRPSLLKEAINSAINQDTQIPYNVLVVDNYSSKENDLEISYIEKLKHSNIRIIKNKENLGMFGNMNQGVALAETDYIAFLHDDDIFSEYFIEYVFKILSKKNITALHVGVAMMQNGVIKGKCKKEKLYKVKDWQLLFNGPGAPTGLVVNRGKFLELSGYDLDYHPTSDFCFSCKIAHFYEYYHYTKILCYYRIEDNESMRTRTLYKFVYNDYFLRRYILRLYKVPEFIINSIQHYIVKKQIKHLKKEFNNDFKFDIPESFNLEGKGSCFEYLILRLFLEIYLRIRSIIYVFKK